jgi:4-amino-4-deoxy-L-arabinose transferase-like glycosyltransferase
VKQKLPIFFSFILLILIVYFPIFAHLDTLPIRMWDEARQANNAYEMYKDGNWVVTHFEGKPDMWNTKPPLLIWMQVGFMKILGVNELSVRLPSAIAAFLTCGLLLFISIRYLKSFWFGFITVIVLVTCQGYISEHGSRTGDYDTLVTFFSLSAGFSLFLYTEEDRKLKYLYFFFLGLTLAVLTKGIAGLLLLPGLFIYLIIRKKIKELLKNKHLYLGMAIFFLIIVSFYVLRELQNPGYFKAIISNELGGRYLSIIEGHEGDFGYYWQNLINYRLSEWVFLVPCGLVIGLSFKEKKMFRLTMFSIILVISYFLIISICKTKLEWYDIPMFPLLSIIISMLIYFIFNFLKNSQVLHTGLKIQVLPFIFLFLLFLSSYMKILNKTFLPKDSEVALRTYELEYFLKGAIKGDYNIRNQYISCSGYRGPNLFYVRQLQDKGIKTGFKDCTQLASMDEVVTYQDDIKEYIKNNYNNEIIGTYGNVLIFKILEKKYDGKKDH